MNKYKKNQKQGIIKLGKGYGLIVPEHIRIDDFLWCPYFNVGTS